MTTKLEIGIQSNKEYMILLPDGRWILPQKYKQQNDDFANLVKHEIFDNWQPSGQSACVDLMNRLNLAIYEPLSDAGHLSYKPRGAMIVDLIAKYAAAIAADLDAIPMKSSVLYDSEDPAIAKHLELFGERSYSVEMEHRSFVMRHAACYGMFAMLRGQKLSYRNMPMAMYELADCYRNELSGALSGMARQRRFVMPDMHILCKRDPKFDNVRRKFVELHEKILSIAEIHDLQYYSIYNVRSDFLANHFEFIKQVVAIEDNPVIIRQIDEDKGYYWVLNIEFCIIDASNRPVEIATIQIDVDNSRRFDISYMDDEGELHNPVIIHAALLGSIERFFDALLEQAAVRAEMEEKPIVLPFWIAPIQIRLIPIADSHIERIEEVAKKLSVAGFRVDIDDREISLSRKIVDAEHELIELVGIIGDKELDSGKISIRDRRKMESYDLSSNGLKKIMEQRQGNMPKIRSYLPKYINSRANIF